MTTLADVDAFSPSVVARISARRAASKPALPAPWTAAALLFVALLPRAIVAVKTPYVCPDGTHYLLLAREQAAGQLTLPLVPELFNPYPHILRGLHAAGLDWEAGAKWWNVLCGAAAVLTLWGWLRRQFDERLAVCAALLCAAHPKLVEWSGEVVREPTFWLALTLALYAGWRGAEESRPGWWLAAGLATALAAQTRFEGWLLLVPLGAWWLYSLATSSHRLRLAVGLVLFLAAFPTVLAGINLAVHGGRQPFQWGTGFHRWLYVQMWWAPSPAAPDAPTIVSAPPTISDAAPITADAPPRAVAEAPPATAATVVVPANAPLAREPAPEPISEPPPPDSTALTPLAAAASAASDQSPPQPAPSPQLAPTPAFAPVLPPMTVPTADHSQFTRRDALRLYVDSLLRGLYPIHAALTLLGLVWGWRTICRFTDLPLVVVALGTLAGIWIHLAGAHLTSSRYWLSAVLLVSPWTALGLIELASRWPWRKAAAGRWAPLPAALAAFVVFGWSYAVALPTDAGRQAKAELGQWVAQHNGVGQRVVGTPRLKMMEYYARADYQILPELGDGGRQWPAWIAAQQADLVALSKKDLGPAQLTELTAELTGHGWRSVAAEDLPASCRAQTVLLTRPTSLAGAAGPAQR